MLSNIVWIFLLGILSNRAFCAQNTNANPKKPAPKPVEDDRYYSILGLGKNIPDPGYYRIRNILRFSDGDETIDGDGKSTKTGFSYFQVADLISIEASLSDRFVVLVAVPYVYRNDLSLNVKAFRGSQRYQAEVSKYSNLFQQKVAKVLKDAGLCPDDASCSAAASQQISSNATLPASVLTLPTGETVSVPASTGTQINSLIGDLVTNAALPTSGATGLGDLDLGASYSLISTGRNSLNLGFGFRIPIGKFEKVPTSQVPTGEGMLQYGIRVSYDLLIGKALMLSIQDQAVGMIFPAHRSKSSLLDPNQLNKADPTTPDALEAKSDGNSNSQIVRKNGLSHDMILRADFGAALFSKALQPLALEVSYNRHIGPEVTYDDTVFSPKQTINSLIYGFKIDGLGYSNPFPAYMRILQEKFLDGTNVPIATNSFYFEISIYQTM